MFQIIDRACHEAVVIGDEIVVTVLSIEEDRVHLGVSCPSATPPYWEQTLYTRQPEQATELQPY